MVFIDNVSSRRMSCARVGDGTSFKNSPGNPAQENLQCIQEKYNSYHPDLQNSIDLIESNRSLIYNEPSDSYFCFTKSSIAAATNTSNHTIVHNDETENIYQVMPKADIKSTQNEISPELGRFSYNWVDTTPTVVSVMRSVDFAYVDTSEATAKSKSESGTEILNIKKRKRIKTPKNHTKIRRNFQLRKIKRRKGTAAYATSTSSCKDSLEGAMNNLSSFFEDLLQTTLRADSEPDTAIKDESKCESNSSSSWSQESSIDALVDSKSFLDNIAVEEHASGTLGWDITTNDTSTDVMTNFVDWTNNAGNKGKQLVCNMTSEVLTPQWSRTATVTSVESLYTEINASSFVNLRRKSDSSKKKRSYDFAKMKILSVPFRKDANKYDSQKKSKPRRMSHKKRMISYLKKQLSDGDRGHSNNSPQSEFFRSLKNIALLKNRLNEERHFLDEPKVYDSKKHKCSKASHKHSKSKSRRTSAKAVKRKIK